MSSLNDYIIIIQGVNMMSEFLEKLSLYFKKEQYKNAFNYTIDWVNKLEKNMVKNFVIYEEVLINKSTNKKIKDKYIDPLIKHLLSEYPELSDYIIYSKLLNMLYFDIYGQMEKELEKYKEYDLLSILFVILSNIESEFHKMNDLTFGN